MVERASATIATVKDNFRDNWPTSAAVYLPGNKVPKPAELFRNQAVGNTYLRIIKEAEAGGGSREAVIERARKVWSQGFVAEAIDRFYTHQELHGRLGPAQQGTAARRGHGEVAGHRRGRRSPTTTAATRCARRARGRRARSSCRSSRC